MRPLHVRATTYPSSHPPQCLGRASLNCVCQCGPWCGRSEKIWKAYGLGVIPVVFASSGAATSLPSEDSFINARSFTSAVRLREHLVTVAADPALYATYFE